jgi:hypothetical protein
MAARRWVDERHQTAPQVEIPRVYSCQPLREAAHLILPVITCTSPLVRLIKTQALAPLFVLKSFGATLIRITPNRTHAGRQRSITWQASKSLLRRQSSARLSKMRLWQGGHVETWRNIEM